MIAFSKKSKNCDQSKWSTWSINHSKVDDARVVVVRNRAVILTVSETSIVVVVADTVALVSEWAKEVEISVIDSSKGAVTSAMDAESERADIEMQV